MFPLLIPNDCLPGMRRIIILVYARMHLFIKIIQLHLPTKRNHVAMLKAVMLYKAFLSRQASGRTLQQRVSGIEHQQSMQESERQTLYQHMRHSQEINKNVYQAPLDVQEVTKVDLENWIT